MTDAPKPTVKIDSRWWALGVVDGFNGIALQHAVADKFRFSYASGRVEGKAAREQGRTIDDVLKEARVPYRQEHFRPTPLTRGRSR